MERITRFSFGKKEDIPQGYGLDTGKEYNSITRGIGVEDNPVHYEVIQINSIAVEDKYREILSSCKGGDILVIV